MKKILLTITITTALISGTIFAGVPVIDAAAIAKAVEQLQSMQQQLEHMKKEFEAITGDRGMDKLLNSDRYNKARDYIPASWQEAMQLAEDGNAGKYNRLQGAINAMNKTGNDVIDKMDLSTSQKQRLKNANNNANGFMVMAGAAYDATSQRTASLKSLIDSIKTAKDPKAIADLNARINAESVMLNNEMLKIQSMQIMQKAKIAQMANAQKAKNIENLKRN